MPAKKYLNLDANGNTAEVQATVVSSGAASDGNIPALDANGRLDQSVMPSGVGATTKTYTASEALSAGALVNITATGVRNADASGGQGKKADGYVLASVANGATATVYVDTGTIITGLTGLTQGTTYFLSATPGVSTATRPTTATHIVQEIGKALSATELKFDPKPAVTLA